MLGPLEERVMGIMWAADGALTVRDVLEELNADRDEDLAYTTVMTTMARLAEKGLLDREREGRGYRYEPAVADTAEVAVRNVVREYGDAALAHFVDEVSDDDDLRRRLEHLLQRGDG